MTEIEAKFWENVVTWVCACVVFAIAILASRERD